MNRFHPTPLALAVMSLLAGAATLSIMILPLVMRTTEEALKSVPDIYREGSYGLGAGKLRTIFRIVLPAAYEHLGRKPLTPPEDADASQQLKF